MDQEKLLQMQMQMRNNNEDYKNFLSDMDSWSNDIKKKELNIMSKSTDDDKKKSHKIRNAVITKKSETKTSRIKAYDYKSWDKFDVDKALKECDEKKSFEDFKVEDSTEDQNTILVNSLKDSGNLHFKVSNFNEAIEDYSKAIDICPSNDILYTNRAMSFIKLGNYLAAESDCCDAISINKFSVKAFYRRSKCRLYLNRQNEALEDLKEILKIDPNNKLVFKEMKELESELNVRGVVEALDHPATGRISKKPLSRISIVDVNPSQSFTNVSYNDSHIVTAPQDNDNKKETSIKCDLQEPICEDKTFLFKIPQTSTQLSKDLSNYRTNSSQLANYVMKLNSSNFKKLIGHALDCELLLDLINGFSLARKYQLIEDEQFIECLTRLSTVARFSSSWFMISDNEKYLFKETISLIDHKLINQLPFTD